MPEKRYKDEDWLREEYVVKQRSAGSIARECGVTLPSVVYYVKKFSMHARTLQKAKKIQRPHNWIDAPFKDKETLYRDYWEEEMSIRQIAEKYGVVMRTIVRWMNRHGIETRSMSEGCKLSRPRGKDSPFYVHGRGYKADNCESAVLRYTRDAHYAKSVMAKV